MLRVRVKPDSNHLITVKHLADCVQRSAQERVAIIRVDGLF